MLCHNECFRENDNIGIINAYTLNKDYHFLYKRELNNYKHKRDYKLPPV